MTFSVNTSLSALMAYGKKIGVHANNIANMHSEGFKRSRALLKEGADQTVTVEIDRIDSPDYPSSETSKSQISNNKSNNVDVATELMGTMTSQRGYKVNSTFIKTQEEMTGTILDMLN